MNYRVMLFSIILDTRQANHDAMPALTLNSDASRIERIESAGSDEITIS